MDTERMHSSATSLSSIEGPPLPLFEIRNQRGNSMRSRSGGTRIGTPR